MHLNDHNTLSMAGLNSSFLDDGSDNEEEMLKGHVGASLGDLKMVTQSIRSDPSALEYQDVEGMTPLAKATQFRQFEVMKRLVKMGANLNTRDAKGRTPLCLAAYEGWYEGILYLLRNGANQSITDGNGRLPLHAATYCTDTRLLSALLQSLSIDEVNQQDNDGMTALHWAAFHGQPEHVKLLMLRGTDIFMTDMDEKTPLHWASQKGSLSCCKALVHCNNGGSKLVNCVEASGKTCVHLAAAAGRGDIIEEFSSIPGVDFEALDPDDRTPLHWASVTGQVDSLKILLKLGLNVSAKDNNGGTPLDYASKAGHTEVANILKEAGAKFGNLAIKTDVLSKQTDGQGQTSRSKFLGIFSTLFGSKRQDNDDKKNSELIDKTCTETVEMQQSNPTKQENNSVYIDNQLTCDVDITLEPSPKLPKSQMHDGKKNDRGGKTIVPTSDLLDTDEEDEVDEGKSYLTASEYLLQTRIQDEMAKTDHKFTCLQKYSPLPSPASMKQDADVKVEKPTSLIGQTDLVTVELSARQILEAQGLNSQKLYGSGKGRLPVLAYRGTINETDEFSSTLPWLRTIDVGSSATGRNRKPLMSLSSEYVDCIEGENTSAMPTRPKLGARPRSKSLNLEGCSVLASVSALCNTMNPSQDTADLTMLNKKSERKKKSKKIKSQKEK
ncbi:inversin-A-like [Anneissia japonica]|uniref:inversin-A-like n=1 Tax=Anneissia japonica TaxID=1529436 RepID=UPI0014257B85|nr:inversin-A-like [Anneissia japonica]XP_033104502.1 inversin-A-like [Anneissia japonica]